MWRKRPVCSGIWAQRWLSQEGGRNSHSVCKAKTLTWNTPARSPELGSSVFWISSDRIVFTMFHYVWRIDKLNCRSKSVLHHFVTSSGSLHSRVPWVLERNSHWLYTIIFSDEDKFRNQFYILKIHTSFTRVLTYFLNGRKLARSAFRLHESRGAVHVFDVIST